ncbi:nucleus accumbens-associated protein 2-like [Periophthalmus magnuspinnatus]|uniref:nucleus accumbens-associated protein 2-like n=1 Tax=Periophthalmus magnuspinnatus TaxID=409849 RepID=UPI00145A1416|nr:nucleus accumbens-associated protein 2-like [Periophthalmus magnuspinnatus]
MAEGLLQVHVPDFGSSVLGSLEEQRASGQYCDVHILVQGQIFKAHRAVLAASSLYFRDLFSSEPDHIQSSESPSVLELPSSVSPACFEQILSFCYTGRLVVAPQEQLVLMYTAGYLQIQNIVERGMELLMKSASSSSSPLCCDSQTSAEELGGFEPPVPQNSAPHRESPDQPCLSSEELLLSVSRIKQERADTPPTEEEPEPRGELRGGALCYLSAGVAQMQSFLMPPGGRCSPGSSPQATEEELDDDFYTSAVSTSLYQHLYPYVPEKLDMLPLPLANERRACVLIGRDNMALPASLVSQIGYRCHPALYAEGDPGEKLELVAGSGVLMTRGQLMNCHLCAGVKHKVLLRRLLATFFDRNTLANSCGTGIRSSTNDPTRKPLDNRVLNTVKLYCQNFAPNFKESEMNVIAADMCTNARRVRKRWLPKIQSLLPTAPPNRLKTRRGGASAGGVTSLSQSTTSPFDADLRSYLPLPDLLKEKEAGLASHLPTVTSRAGGSEAGAGHAAEGVGVIGGATGADGGQSLEQHESSSDASCTSSHPSPQPPDQD